MSKHRPDVAAKTTPLKPSDPAAITADSALVDILKAKVRVRTEIQRRKAYQDFLALRSELEKLPRVPDLPPVTPRED